MKTARLAVICLALAAVPGVQATVSDENLPLNIGVRSSVDRPFQGLRKAPLKEHGKVYLIASIAEGRYEEQLVMPLKEDILLAHLQAVLAKRGFRPATPDHPPEIILTILYGRGLLKNPYLNDVMINDSTNPPRVSIQGVNVKQLMKQKEFGFEEKLQSSNFEKLYIHIVAWANPDDLPPTKSGRNKKPKELWKTTIVTDDPANRDLNQFVEKMLAAGANYFDREIEDEEAIITTDLPEGYVKFGETRIMPDQEK
ncbi:MAG: hypothetical protein K9M98_14040 [Cephaloticoccus sp.]|nr:hypothetical protein [Cephaloticoccus sp.]MCF7761616.1 hypothetical protein [Cephaloticoccus sp.]